ncbi:hypothetical protein BJX99DRAFT_255386 [Aspergillus californicus]
MAIDPKTSRQWNFPYIVIPRLPEKHTHTFIILSDGAPDIRKFGRTYLKHTEQDKDHPTARFVFLSARRTNKVRSELRVTWERWVGPPGSSYEWCVEGDPNPEGLEDSCIYVNNVVFAEAEILKKTGLATKNFGFDRIVLGGYGDAAAVGLWALLGGSVPEQLAGFLGLDPVLPCPVGFKGTDPTHMYDDLNLFQETLGNDLLRPPEYDGEVCTTYKYLITTPVFLGYGSMKGKNPESYSKLHKILTDGLGMEVSLCESANFSEGVWPREFHAMRDLKSQMSDFLIKKVQVPF